MSNGCKIEKLSKKMDELGLTEYKKVESILFGLVREEITLSKQNKSASDSARASVSVPAPTPAPTPITNAVRSPMVGVVYFAPEPGAEPFIKVGQSVKAGDTLCLIEAMKTFNKVLADSDGVVRELLVSEGSPVEFDTPLVVIE